MENIPFSLGQAGGTYAFFICNNSFAQKDFSNKSKRMTNFDVINDPIRFIGLFFTYFF